MRKVLRNLLLLLLVIALNNQAFIGLTQAKTDPNSYTVFKTVDKDSFNEYRYLITKEFFKIKNKWDVDWILDSVSLNKLKDLSSRSYNYLPDNNLENDNLLNNLNTAISKALKYQNSDAAYIWLIKSIWNYLDKTSIWGITWEVNGLPKSWNAPFNVTLRANVSDPTWTKIPKYNYVWWMDYGSRKVNIWTGPSINYTFKEEGTFTVFVDIKSAHKNGKWYTDVIPYRWEVKIQVREKVASLIVKVNWDRLWYRERLKFTPAQAKYGLLFDATSSTPTGSAKFTRTEWNFGNWIKKSYSGEPKIERIKYTKEWDFDIKLKLKTNLWKEIEKEFLISIHDPIATIDVSPKEWFLGDKFTFRAKNTTNDNNLTYNWQIVDIINDEVVFSEQTKLFTYNFKNKWHFNVRLEVNWIDSADRNIDTKNIYINSRAPVADFKSSIPESNKPNRILLDATDSFDPDFVDTGKLKYSWEINGSRVNLEDANSNWSVWFYTFSNIWDHSVVLRVEDPDSIEWTKKDKVTVSSILSLDFSTNPRAIKRGNSISFDAVSPEAEFFEWDFGDWDRSTGWVEDKIKHKYEKTGIFNVKLKVIDKTWKSNIQTKVVYVWNWENPVAILNVWNNTNNTVIEKNSCKWQEAYIADRITPINFDSWTSIDIDWNSNDLDYSLKIWANKYFTSRNTTYKFDELGCFPVILKVTSKKNRSSDTKKIWVKVKNIEPSLSKLVAKTDSLDTEPVVVTVDAVWALDRDWVITSYLWYYYTDLDEEPQDFRSTIWPSTKFVLPKITWNYYFVALLTDDSDSRVSSKDLWKSSSLTLAWNNVNVPILELKTPDNSVHVSDEVIFNAKVQNILKQDISKKVKYFWDFDWDWFYDLETKTPHVTHIYDKPGTFYAKLKVKHKGFSNTRNVEINVANSLVPRFDYVSVWNKFSFVNKTTGSYENFSFDLEDWTKIENKDYFEHTYKDWKSSHKVVLTVSDWNTVKKFETKVVKNIKNLLKYKKSKAGILLVNPNADIDNNIIINERASNISVILLQNNKDFSEISADSDLDKDSDLNGWKEDDSDVISIEDTYLNIELNKNKIQNIRVSAKDSDWKVIISKDYKIIKNYIKDEDINLDKVLFEWVSELQKQKLEELKSLVSSISWDDWRAAKTYVSRLKDEWNDSNERTKVIYEFEGFLESSLVQNKNEIVEKLEELLLKENDDNSLKSVALRALQWLTPSSIQCDFNKDEYKSCKDYIDSSLEVIKSNEDIDQNKILWKSILSTIWKDETLSTDEKLNYKRTLQNLIYWDVSNIPKEPWSDEEENEEKGGIISSILKAILYIILSIVWLFVFGGLIYFIYYKLSNKKSDKWFKDFVEQKTSSKDDIFTEIKEDKLKDSLKVDKPDFLWKNNDLDQKSDIFSLGEDSNASVPSKKDNFNSDKNNSPFEIKPEIKKDEKNQKSTNSSDVPDWLKWSNEAIETKDESKPNKLQNNSIVNNKKEVIKKEEVVKDIVESKKESSIDKTKIEDSKKLEDLDKLTKVEDDIPDWLKGSLEETSKKDDIVKEEIKEIPTKKEIKSDNKIEDDIPDWLKGSLEDKPKKEEVKKDDSKIINVEDEKEMDKSSKTNEPSIKSDIKKSESDKIVLEDKKESKKEVVKKEVTKKQAPKKTPTKKTSVKKDDKKEEVKKITPSKKEETKDSKNTKTKKDSSDLWDDGMDVPDWLKS